MHQNCSAIECEIDEAIAEVKLTAKTKVSREKTMRGRLLYSPKELNIKIKAAFHRRGFRELRDPYTVKIPNYPAEIRGSFKQIDFVKERVLVEAQFGKYFSMFYDMAKLQYFFNKNQADVGVEIVACHPMRRQMSTGVAYGEQLIYDLERLGRNFPTFPVKVIMIDVEAPPASRERLDELIRQQGVDAEIIRPGVPTASVEQAAAALGVDPQQVIKALLFQAKDGECLLIITCGQARLNMRRVARATGKAGWRMAKPDVALGMTGFPIDGIPPIGHERRLRVLLDSRVMDQEVVYGGGGDVSALLRIRTMDIQQLTGAETHDLIGPGQR